MDIESFLQGEVLALVELVLGCAAERGALVQTLVVVDQVGGTTVSVDVRNVVIIQFLL